MALHCYLDAGGTKDHLSLSCGGWIATEENWQRFHADWTEVMAAEGVRELHMSKLAHFQGEYRPWKGDEDRRIRFIKKLVAIITKYTIRHVVTTLHLDIYKRLNEQATVEERLGSPYVLTMLSAILMAKDWHEKHAPSETMSVFIEHGDEDQGLLLKILKRFEFPYPLAVLPKRQKSGSGVQYITPFQAADFLAYEFYKGVKEMRSTGQHEIKGRKSLLALVPVGPDEYSRVIDIHALAVYVKAFGVTRRAPNRA